MKITIVGSRGPDVTVDRAALLTPALRETARLEANAWIKRLRHVRYNARDHASTMRERFTYKGDSLWWFTELYLHKMRRLDVAVETILALGAARDVGATRVIVSDADDAGREAALAFGRAHQVSISVAGDHESGARFRHEQQSLLVGWTGWLSRLRPRMTRPARRPAVAAFVHTAFWRSADPQEEMYVGPVLDALIDQASRERVALVGLGPKRNFRVRRWWDPMTSMTSVTSPVTSIERFASARAIRGSARLWKARRRLAEEVTSGDDVRAAGTVLGCDLWPVLKRELEGVALVQWPWSARTMDEAAAALDALEPGVVVTYAEAGAWGRALVLEARRRGVPSIGLQHGFIYRHWLNYLHEPDEMMPAGGDDRGFPCPDRTLLYDRYASEHLASAGHFSASRLSVTGSARLETLMTRMATLGRRREELRQRHGVRAGQTMAVLAAKFSEIQDELPALVEAASQVRDLHLVIKPHPAETPALYTAAAAGRPRVSVASGSADLAELLAAADAIVTMNSTVAIDGLVLGLPTVVVGLPNNLSPFVEAGVMLGANGAEKIRSALEAVLYDRQVQSALKDRAGAFASRYGLAPEPAAATRAAAEILAAARGST